MARLQCHPALPRPGIIFFHDSDVRIEPCHVFVQFLLFQIEIKRTSLAMIIGLTLLAHPLFLHQTFSSPIQLLHDQFGIPQFRAHSLNDGTSCCCCEKSLPFNIHTTVVTMKATTLKRFDTVPRPRPNDGSSCFCSSLDKMHVLFPIGQRLIHIEIMVWWWW
jgi:hypothetical protein